MTGKILVTTIPSKNDKDAHRYQQDARDTTSYNQSSHYEVMIVVSVLYLFTFLSTKLYAVTCKGYPNKGGRSTCHAAKQTRYTLTKTA